MSFGEGKRSRVKDFLVFKASNEANNVPRGTRNSGHPVQQCKDTRLALLHNYLVVSVNLLFIQRGFLDKHILFLRVT